MPIKTTKRKPISEETRLKLSEAAKRNWSDPTDKEYREMMTKTMGKFFRSAEFKEIMFNLWYTPSYKEAVSAAISKGMKQFWQKRKGFQ